MSDTTHEAPERIWADGNQDWDSGSWGQDKEYANDVEYVRADRIEELEGKLAWAVGELEEMLMFQNSEAAYGILRVYTKALLRELKGQDDE